MGAREHGSFSYNRIQLFERPEDRLNVSGAKMNAAVGWGSEPDPAEAGRHTYPAPHRPEMPGTD